MIYIAILSLISAILVVLMASFYISYLKQRIYELEAMNDSLMECLHD